MMTKTTNLSLFLSLIFSLGLLQTKAQTSVSITPFQLYVSEIPNEMKAANGVTYLNYNDLVSQFSPSVRVHSMFAKHWGWFAEGGFTGMTEEMVYNPETTSPYNYEWISYSRMDMTTFVGFEFWSGNPADHLLVFRQSVSAGFFLRLMETQKGVLNGGNLGYNTRSTLSFEISSKYRLNLMANYGIRTDNGDVMHRTDAGLGVEIVLGQ